MHNDAPLLALMDLACGAFLLLLEIRHEVSEVVAGIIKHIGGVGRFPHSLCDWNIRAGGRRDDIWITSAPNKRSHHVNAIRIKFKDHDFLYRPVTRNFSRY